jgi:hypothetical protein
VSPGKPSGWYEAATPLLGRTRSGTEESTDRGFLGDDEPADETCAQEGEQGLEWTRAKTTTSGDEGETERRRDEDEGG